MIITSIFDLFKVGPGPSSSHTIGPMKATYDFLQRVKELPAEQKQSASAINIHLYGSLSLTGKGHGTDRAVVAGLLGWLPEDVNPTAFNNLLKDSADTYDVSIDPTVILVSSNSVKFEKKKYISPFSNTLVVKLLSESGELIHEEEYYSVGGGFIHRKGEDEVDTSTIQLPFPYQTMDELKALLQQTNLSLVGVMLANETAISGLSKKEIYAKIDNILDFMHKAVKRGLRTRGVLPGRIQLRRKAPLLFEKAKNRVATNDSFIIFLNAYCLAASEENAAGSIVVTAPTSGASGVIPGVTYLLKQHYHYDRQRLREGMIAAATIGFLIKQNASISGAEMGCMGEIGSAAAMAAAMLMYCTENSIDRMEAAAEIAIEHHLGMTCDPIGGYVQIPCIERNAMGAIKAYNAFLLASSGNAQDQKISLDSVIKVMRATGKDMSKRYKATSKAGLALSMTEC
ncbi:MAG: L-serine ammonia-lyase [Spirosomataceae bacterium]